MGQIPIDQAAEQICEYLYNLSIPEQTEILKENFGVEIEDTDEGVVWEGTLITDSQFDSHFMDIIESMNRSTIIELWSNYVGFECDLDEDNNIVWNNEDEN